MKKQILAALGEHPWAAHLHRFDSIGSTNDHAKQLADGGAPHGTVILAGRQTCGRGRTGHTFQSDDGGMYLSVILRPACKADKLMHLTCAAACAACDAIEDATGFRPGIKWINDILSGDRKLGGILTELSIGASGDVKYAVVGIGINCLQETADFPPELRSIAVSLKTVTGKSVSVSALAAAMIRSLSRMDRRLLTDQAGIMAQYRRDCTTVGQQTVVREHGKDRCATVTGIRDDGALILQYDDGTSFAVNSGEYSFHKT